MGLFHKDVWLPKRVAKSVPTGVQRLTYSEHAKKAAMDDRYGCIPLSCAIDVSLLEIIEVEHYPNSGWKKAVLRETIGDCHRVFVVIPAARGLFVKTVWMNKADDLHNTLCRGAYEKQK